MGDTDGAIASLDDAWRVYPCPHSVSFGLREELATKLANVPQVRTVVEIVENIER